MKAAIYLRVSSRDGRQDETNQEPDCIRLCESRGWAPEIYRERESGVKARPVWAAVLEAARVGEVRAVVVWSLDRVGRTRVQIAHDLDQLFRWGVVVASARDSWLDVAGPARDLLVQILGWVAEGERRTLIERTNAGLARARAAGTRLGRPPILIDLVRLAGMRAAGMSIRQIALELGIDRGTVRVHLHGKNRSPVSATPPPRKLENGFNRPA